MRIRMRAMLAGPAGALEAGRVYDLDEERARRLVADGAAEQVDAQEPAEDAPAAPADPAEAGPDTEREEQLREWTVMDLRNYASDRKIDLGEASRKLDIIAAIVAAERG